MKVKFVDTQLFERKKNEKKKSLFTQEVTFFEKILTIKCAKLVAEFSCVY